MRTIFKRKHITAIHEGAHAVVYHMFGHQVEYVTIRANYRTQAAGRTKVTHRGYWHKTAIIAGFAGMWAQNLFTDAALNAGCSEDFREINRLLDQHFTFLDYPQRVVLRAELKEISYEMVTKHEKSIRVVAAYLLEHGHIGNWRGGTEATETLKLLMFTIPA